MRPVRCDESMKHYVCACVILVLRLCEVVAKVQVEITVQVENSQCPFRYGVMPYLKNYGCGATPPYRTTSSADTCGRHCKEGKLETFTKARATTA